MGTTTRRIKKKVTGRRGHHTQTRKLSEIKIPDAEAKKRIRAFLIDLILLCGFAEFLYFRSAANILLESSTGPIARLAVYVFSFLFLYIFPLRIFGQSIGMKLNRIRLLLNEDLSFVPVSAIIQRQSIGIILNCTVGLFAFLKDKKVVSDDIFKTKVVEIEKD